MDPEENKMLSEETFFSYGKKLFQSLHHKCGKMVLKKDRAWEIRRLKTSLQ
jgi:hypothetical protein